MEILPIYRLLGMGILSLAATLLAEAWQQGRRLPRLEEALATTVKSAALIASLIFGALALGELGRTGGLAELQAAGARVAAFRTQERLLFWMLAGLGALTGLVFVPRTVLPSALSLARGVVAFPAAFLGWVFEPDPPPAAIPAVDDGQPKLRAKWELAPEEDGGTFPAYLITGSAGEEEGLILILPRWDSWYRFSRPHAEEAIQIELLDIQIEKAGEEPGAIYRWKGESWELLERRGPYRTRVEGSQNFLQGEELVTLRFLESQEEEGETALLLRIEYTGGRGWMQAGRLVFWGGGREIEAAFAESLEGRAPEALPADYETLFQN